MHVLRQRLKNKNSEQSGVFKKLITLQEIKNVKSEIKK
jgi:hypothetical protein